MNAAANGPDPIKRRRSTLADEQVWSVNAQPDPTPESDHDSTPTPEPAAPARPGRTETPRADQPRGRSRDREEARGRKLARDAAYSWAASAARTEDRLRELATELDAAIGRGTHPTVLADYLTEACTRFSVSTDQLPDSVRGPMNLP